MSGVMDNDRATVGESAHRRWIESGIDAALISWADLAAEAGLVGGRGPSFDEAVLVRSSNEVECVVAATPDWLDVQRAVRDLIERGWTVTVLTQLGVLGLAHEILHGSKARLQGWWAQEDGAGLRFTTKEIA